MPYSSFPEGLRSDGQLEVGSNGLKKWKDKSSIMMEKDKHKKNHKPPVMSNNGL